MTLARRDKFILKQCIHQDVSHKESPIISFPPREASVCITMKGNGKKVFKFILTGGGCFADPDVIKHKIKEIKEKRASKDKKPTIR